MSLSSRLRRARAHADRPALPPGAPTAPPAGARAALPRRRPAVDPPLTAPTRPGRPVLSAMERIVERERPGYQVERAACLARAAVRRQPRWSASGVHLPGNGPEDLAAPRPAVPLPRLARTPWSPTPPTL